MSGSPDDPALEDDPFDVIAPGFDVGNPPPPPRLYGRHHVPRVKVAAIDDAVRDDGEDGVLASVEAPMRDPARGPAPGAAGASGAGSRPAALRLVPGVEAMPDVRGVVKEVVREVVVYRDVPFSREGEGAWGGEALTGDALAAHLAMEECSALDVAARHGRILPHLDEACAAFFGDARWTAYLRASCTAAIGLDLQGGVVHDLAPKLTRFLPVMDGGHFSGRLADLVVGEGAPARRPADPDAALEALAAMTDAHEALSPESKARYAAERRRGLVPPSRRGGTGGGAAGGLAGGGAAGGAEDGDLPDHLLFGGRERDREMFAARTFERGPRSPIEHGHDAHVYALAREAGLWADSGGAGPGGPEGCDGVPGVERLRLEALPTAQGFRPGGEHSAGSRSRAELEAALPRLERPIADLWPLLRRVEAHWPGTVFDPVFAPLRWCGRPDAVEQRRALGQYKPDAPASLKPFASNPHDLVLLAHRSWDPMWIDATSVAPGLPGDPSRPPDPSRVAARMVRTGRDGGVLAEPSAELGIDFVSWGSPEHNWVVAEHRAMLAEGPRWSADGKWFERASTLEKLVVERCDEWVLDPLCGDDARPDSSGAVLDGIETRTALRAAILELGTGSGLFDRGLALNAGAWGAVAAGGLVPDAERHRRMECDGWSLWRRHPRQAAHLDLRCAWDASGVFRPYAWADPSRIADGRRTIGPTLDDRRHPDALSGLLAVAAVAPRVAGLRPGAAVLRSRLAPGRLWAELAVSGMEVVVAMDGAAGWYGGATAYSHGGIRGRIRACAALVTAAVTARMRRLGSACVLDVDGRPARGRDGLPTGVARADGLAPFAPPRLDPWAVRYALWRDHPVTREWGYGPREVAEGVEWTRWQAFATVAVEAARRGIARPAECTLEMAFWCDRVELPEGEGPGGFRLMPVVPLEGSGQDAEELAVRPRVAHVRGVAPDVDMRPDAPEPDPAAGVVFAAEAGYASPFEREAVRMEGIHRYRPVLGLTPAERWPGVPAAYFDALGRLEGVGAQALRVEMAAAGIPDPGTALRWEAKRHDPDHPGVFHNPDVDEGPMSRMMRVRGRGADSMLDLERDGRGVPRPLDPTWDAQGRPIPLPEVPAPDAPLPADHPFRLLPQEDVAPPRVRDPRDGWRFLDSWDEEQFLKGLPLSRTPTPFVEGVDVVLSAEDAKAMREVEEAEMRGGAAAPDDVEDLGGLEGVEGLENLGLEEVGLVGLEETSEEAGTDDRDADSREPGPGRTG